MEQNLYAQYLGKTLFRLIKQEQLPKLEFHLSLDERQVTSLHGLISGLPIERMRLKKTIVNMLVKGEIQEIQLTSSSLTMLVQCQMGRECYNISLSLYFISQKWELNEVYFTHVLPPALINKKHMISSVSLVALIMLIIYFAYSPFVSQFSLGMQEDEPAEQHQNVLDAQEADIEQLNLDETANDSLADSTEINDTSKHLDLEQIIALLEEQNYVILTQEEARLLTNHEHTLSQTETEDREQIMFEIETGMSTSRVAQILYQHQLIDDISGFIDSVRERGLTTRLQVGTYIVYDSVEESELITMITSK